MRKEKELSYQEYYDIAETAVRELSIYKFFRDGAVERAAAAAFVAQSAGAYFEVVIDVIAENLDRDSHVCYFDDPCDAWAA